MTLVVGKAKWASVITPNTKFEPVYTVNLIVDDSTRDLLIGLNLTPIKGETNEFRFKRTAVYKDGSSAAKPNCVDASNIPFTGMIGNGSEVIVDFEAKVWTYAGKTGTKALLGGVQVIDLIPYGTPENNFETHEGFAASAADEEVEIAEEKVAAAEAAGA